jgi:hypothetical protein
MFDGFSRVSSVQKIRHESGSQFIRRERLVERLVWDDSGQRSSGDHDEKVRL